MTKSQLRTGMIVTNTLGEELMVFIGVQTCGFCGDCLVQIDGTDEWDELDNYNEDLTNRSPSARELDIIRVSVPYQPAYFFTDPNRELEVIWERKQEIRRNDNYETLKGDNQ